MTRPLSDLQRRVLLVLLDAEERDSLAVLTPNEIGGRLDLKPVEGGGSGAKGRGAGHRVFGPAQRIISPLNGLRGRGLVGLSFVLDYGYSLTAEGKRTAEALKEQR